MTSPIAITGPRPPTSSFQFEGTDVRVTDREGAPWWVLNDVCRVLGISNPHDAAQRLDDDEKGVGSTDTLGGTQNLNIINESGLYSLIMTSRKAAAKRFKKWVTAEVLPQIRRTGSYGQVPVRLEPADVRQLRLAHSKTVEAMETQIRTLARLAKAMTIEDTALFFDISIQELTSHMQSVGWIYPIQGVDGFLGYKRHIQAGHVEHQIRTILLVGPQGVAQLATIFPDANPF